MSNIKHVTKAHLLLVAKHRMPTVYNALHDNKVNIHTIVNCNVNYAYAMLRNDTLITGLTTTEVVLLRDIMRHVDAINVCVRLQDAVHNPELSYSLRRILKRVAIKLLTAHIAKLALEGNVAHMHMQITTLEDIVAARVNLAYGYESIRDGLYQLQQANAKIVGLHLSNKGKRRLTLERTNQHVRVVLFDELDVSFWVRHTAPMTILKVIDNKRGSVLTTSYHAIQALNKVNDALRDVQAWEYNNE